MRFLLGTLFGLAVTALVNAVGLDNVTAALRAADAAVKATVHQVSTATAKATEDRSHGR